MSELLITNEDCMELMARYPDGYFDLAIVDPPYGIGAAQGVGKYGLKKHKRGKANWDTAPPTKEYWDRLFSVTQNQIVCGGNYFMEYLSSSQAVIAWIKNNPAPSFADFELIWTSFNHSAVVYDSRKQIIHAIAEDGGSIHPTQKPVALYKWLLEKYAKPIQDKLDRPMRILDTHLGSGSIAIACHDYGYDLTACELDTDYYNAAMKRIKQHTSQLKLL